MRDPSPRRWHRWRAALPAPAAIADRLACVQVEPPRAARTPTEEIPGPDGIRHGLVARVRAEIAAGIYDTDEKWLAAEEALLERVAAGT